MKANEPANYTRTEPLRDGRSVIIRGIPPDDPGGMREALDKVNCQLLYRRLFLGKREFSAEEINRLTAIHEVWK